MHNLRISIKVNPISVIAAILFFATGYGIEYMCAFLSISIHEILHVCCGKFLKMEVYGIKVLPAGLTAEIDETNASINQKIIMYLCGPLSNVILIIITIAIQRILNNSNFLHNEINDIKINDIIVTFYQMNIYLAIFNLIPIMPLDGGKVLFEIIAKKKGLQTTYKYIKIISFSLLFIILVIGIILSYLFYNFNILVIGIYLAYLIKSMKWEVAFMNLKQLLFRRSRILRKGIYPVRTIVVMKNISLGEVLKNMDSDGFHIVYILDDTFKLINTFTEQDIIDGLIEYNNEITFEEFMKKKL